MMRPVVSPPPASTPSAMARPDAGPAETRHRPAGTAARTLAADCLATDAPMCATATATGAFEALMDWVEGRP